ncbi:MAG: hypothetical protein IPH35_18890 [Rhodoferax sp.]|nr:hypothetical protein [Rhodoferax sp.]
MQLSPHTTRRAGPRIPLTLEAVATQGPHYWLPGGKLVAQNQNQHKKTARLVLDSAGNAYQRRFLGGFVMRS